MKKKIVDCTIKELANYCKKHNNGGILNSCAGCKLNAKSRYCLAGWPVGITKGVRNKTIEVQE